MLSKRHKRIPIDHKIVTLDKDYLGTGVVGKQYLREIPVIINIKGTFRTYTLNDSGDYEFDVLQNTDANSIVVNIENGKSIHVRFPYDDLKHFKTLYFEQTVQNQYRQINPSTIDVTPFFNLETLRLNCAYNNSISLVQELDISKNEKLSYLEFAGHTKLQSINFSNNPNLENVQFYFNDLVPSIDLSNKTKLKIANLQQNKNLTSVNLQGSNLVEVINLQNCKLQNINQLDLTNKPNLRVLELTNNTQVSGNINLTNNTNLENLELSNTKIAQIQGLNDLSRLKILGIRNLASTLQLNNFDINNYPQLETFYCDNSNMQGNFNYTQVNNVMQRMIIGQNLGITSFDFSKIPNLTYLHFGGDNNGTYDFSPLTKLTYVYISGFTGNNGGILNFQNATNLKSFSVFVGSRYRMVICPNTSMTNVNISRNTNLSTIQNLNSHQHTAEVVHLQENRLSQLDTSFGSDDTCFPMCKALAVGGQNDTYTSTKVFDLKKQLLSIIQVFGNRFVVNGDLKDLFPVASWIEIKGNSNLDYVNPLTATTFIKVILNPRSGELKTNGDKVAQLIKDLSTKNWTNTTTLIFGNHQKVLDVRGCAVPTASTELNQAKELLVSKGVTVLHR